MSHRVEFGLYPEGTGKSFRGFKWSGTGGGQVDSLVLDAQS